MPVDYRTVILNFPAIRQLSNIESLTIAGNGRFWAGNEIRRDGLQWRYFFVVFVYFVCCTVALRNICVFVI